MSGLTATGVAHRFVSRVLKPGDYCIDATVGNGHDTTFLAKAVGETGMVLGLDIQKVAVERTMKLLMENQLQYRVVLEQKNHQELSSSICRLDWLSVKLVMFNLGYLPGSDKSVITQPETTVSALNSCLELLSECGAVSIVAYRGHAGGVEEYQAVRQWVNELSALRYLTLRFENGLAGVTESPAFFWVRRRY